MVRVEKKLLKAGIKLKHLQSFIVTISVLCCFSLPSNATTIIAAQGSVTTLTDVTSLSGVLGTADFDGNIDPSITFHSGTTTLDSILPGINVNVPPPPILGGTATSTVTNICTHISSGATFFPGPISGGGSASGNCLVHGVATFDQHVTQVGFTAGWTSGMYLTAFDATGAIIGQVNWAYGCGQPTQTCPTSFIGIDTLGTAIAMVIWGNDDLYSGETFQVAGITPYSDNWIWASGGSSQVPLPAAFPLFLLGLGGLRLAMRRRRHPITPPFS